MELFSCSLRSYLFLARFRSRTPPCPPRSRGGNPELRGVHSTWMPSSVAARREAVTSTATGLVFPSPASGRAGWVFPHCQLEPPCCGRAPHGVRRRCGLDHGRHPVGNPLNSRRNRTRRTPCRAPLSSPVSPPRFAPPPRRRPRAAQEWPTRPITLVVPFSPGGGVDISARLQAQAIGDILGQSVVVENIGGGAGMTAGARVAHAAPDGYTFMIGNAGTHAFTQTLYKKPLYNSVTDFTPVGLVSESPRIVDVRKDLPVKNLQEFIAWLEGQREDGAVRLGRRRHRHPSALRAVQPRDRREHHQRAVPRRRRDHPGPARRTASTTCATSSRPARSSQTRLREADRRAGRRTASPIIPEVPTAGGTGPGRRRGLGAWNGFFLPKGTPDRDRAQAQRGDRASRSRARRSRARLEELGLEIVPPEHRTPEYLAKLPARGHRALGQSRSTPPASARIDGAPRQSMPSC